MLKFTKVLPILVATAIPAVHASADVVITATEVGSDVVVAGGGTLDLTGMEALNFNSGSSGTDPADSIMFIGGTTVGASPLDAYRFLQTIPAFGPGTAFVSATSETGDIFGFFGPSNAVVVPDNYVSGDPLAGQSTFAGQSFASLGLTPGAYVVDLPSGDTFTFNVVPEPTSLALLGMGGLTLLRRRRRA